MTSTNEDIFISASEKHTPVDAETLSAAEDSVQESSVTAKARDLIREFVDMVIRKTTRRA